MTQGEEVIADSLDGGVPFIQLVLGIRAACVLVLFSKVNDLHLELAGVAQPAPAV